MRLLPLLVLLSCAPSVPIPPTEAVAGPPGPQGIPGEPGPAGPVGAPGQAGGVAWRDSTGALVVVGSSPQFFDSRGLIWGVNAETGKLANAYGDAGSALGYYLSGDCDAGSEVVLAPLPRTPFKSFQDGRWRVRPDTMQSTVADLTAARNMDSNDGGCFALGFKGQRVVPVTPETLPAQPITEPSVSYAPPLHIERI